MKRELKFIAFISLLLYFAISASGQCEKNNVFDEIPVLARERLIERLNLRLEYEKTGQWDKLYDLFYPTRINEADYLKKKEEYIRINSDPADPRDHIMIEFVPKIITSASEIGDGAYFIEGCATFRFKGKNIKENDIIVAHLVNKEWYFSSFGEVAPNPKLCEQ